MPEKKDVQHPARSLARVGPRPPRREEQVDLQLGGDAELLSEGALRPAAKVAPLALGRVADERGGVAAALARAAARLPPVKVGPYASGFLEGVGVPASVRALGAVGAVVHGAAERLEGPHVRLALETVGRIL